MVTHIVLFKMKDRSGADARRIHDALLGMKGRIPGMRDIEVGLDYLRSQRSYDVALITRHDTREALEAYQVHPVHEEVKKLILELREASVAVDFEA
jgi:hypothetical protein